jgi:hypothetical protein
LRRNKIEVLLPEGDETSKGWLCFVELYDDDFAQSKVLQQFTFEAEDGLPFSMYWDWYLRQLLKNGPASVASVLPEKAVAIRVHTF